MRYGLVLGAGGTLGEAFHQGVLRAMRELGLDPRTAAVLVGTSAGSLVAASLREPVRDEPAQPPVVLRRASATSALAARPRQLRNALLLAPELFSGRLSTAGLVAAVRRRHGTTWPAAPLWVVAVRRRDGRRAVFGRPGEPVTDVASAVAASCAIPGYFEPVEIDGARYVDGGVHSPTNADLLATTDLELVVISSPLSMRLPRSVRPRLDLGLRLLFTRYLRTEVRALRQRGRRVVTIEPDAAMLALMGVNMMAGRTAAQVQQRAYGLALAQLREVIG